MTFREPDQEAIDVLVHVLASMMPDVLDKKRLERWLGFAKSIDQLWIDEDDGYDLHISTICNVSPSEGEYREFREVNPSTQVFTPELGRIIGNKCIILKFEDEEIEVEYGSMQIFKIFYNSLPWLAIHALQTNPGTRTISSNRITS